MYNLWSREKNDDYRVCNTISLNVSIFSENPVTFTKVAFVKSYVYDIGWYLHDGDNRLKFRNVNCWIHTDHFKDVVLTVKDEYP